MTCPALQFEPTEQGDQAVMPGVAPITARQRLELIAAAPMTTDKPQKPLDIGLFDEAARRQLSLF